MKKTKILLMSLTNRMGGIEVLQRNIIQMIDKQKFDFTITVNGGNGAFEEEITAAGGHVVHLPSLKQPIQYCRKIIELLKQEQFDVAHIHKISCTNFLPFILCKRYHVKRIIAHAHAIESQRGWIGNLSNAIGRLFVIPSIHYAIACSQEAALWLFGKKYCANHDVIVLRNGINSSMFKYNETKRSEIRNELNVEHFKVIGHVGRFVKQKNHQFIIRLFHKIHQLDFNTVLLLIGGGDLVEPMKKLAHQLSLDNHVIFLEEKSSIADYYQAMDIFILPSLTEASPIALIEAMINGLPCLTSSEIKDVNIQIQVETLNLEESQDVWIKKISELLNHQRYDNVDKLMMFDIEKTVQELTELYI